MKNKTFIIIIAILMTILYIMIGKYSLKEINKEKINVSKYIEITDHVSKNYGQINWKYVASIVGVLEKNNFGKVDDKKIESVAQKFLEKTSNRYKIKTLGDVLKDLELSKSKKKLVNEYINQLEYFGLKPSRLEQDTKYYRFIENIKDAAIKNYKEYKILPSITIAQAILESGWGEAALAKEYNNLFGIKADKYWDGESIVLETTEFKGEKINDAFRKYKYQGDSIKDHGKFLYKNKRYKNNGVFEANTYIYQANALQEAGYSTAMNGKGEKVYANRLIEIIRQYNLQLIDSEVQSEL